MPPSLIIGGGGISFPVVRPLTPTSCDAISPYLVEGFQWNFVQIFIMWVCIAGRVLRSAVKGQGYSKAKCTFPAEGCRP